jgi:hypothetical protein
VANVILDFDATNNILRATIKDRITEAIVFGFYAAAIEYLAIHPPCSGILDLSLVTEFEVSSAAIKRVATTPLPPTSGESRWILVAQKDVIYGLARMFQILTETKKNHFEVQVVRTIDAAYRLLQVSDPEFRPVRL